MQWFLVAADCAFPAFLGLGDAHSRARSRDQHVRMGTETPGRVWCWLAAAAHMAGVPGCPWMCPPERGLQASRHTYIWPEYRVYRVCLDGVCAG